MNDNTSTNRPCTMQNVIEVLKNVYDPEIDINIIDLGLVFGIWIGKFEINIEFTATYPGCPMIEVIQETIVNELEKSFSGKKANARVVWHTPWNASLMNEETRIVLGY